MIRIDVVTGFPRIVSGPIAESMLKRAQENGCAQIAVHDLREYASDKHRTIDDTPYGGGAGMVLKPEPIFACIETLRSQRHYDEVILMAADGDRLGQKTATELSLMNNLLIVCGHYKGVDERVKSLVTREISIGEYVLTGGELPALVLIDAVVRLIPGVLSDGESLLRDSFQEETLGAPEYTRPAEFRGMKVPDVLLSGNHLKIEDWREEQRRRRMADRRDDIIDEPKSGA